jgi:hypothetical protein
MTASSSQPPRKAQATKRVREEDITDDRHQRKPRAQGGRQGGRQKGKKVSGISMMSAVERELLGL